MLYNITKGESTCNGIKLLLSNNLEIESVAESDLMIKKINNNNNNNNNNNIYTIVAYIPHRKQREYRLHLFLLQNIKIKKRLEY